MRVAITLLSTESLRSHNDRTTRCAGDVLTRYLSSSGRIVAAQFSVLMTFPCTLIIYKLLPITAPGGMNTMMAPYACVFFVTGALISW